MWSRRIFSQSGSSRNLGGLGGTACSRATCAGCPVVNGCLSSRALFRPLPWWYWGVIGTTTATSLYVAYSSSKSTVCFCDAGTRTWRTRRGYATSGATGAVLTLIFSRNASGPARSRVVGILDLMGIRAGNVKILLTRGGSPSAVGHESDGLLLLPEDLVALMEPNSDVHVESAAGLVYYSGKVGGLSDAVRREILDGEALLLPSMPEIDYILGHEAAHLRHRDSLRKPLAGLAVALGAHGALKGYNYAVLNQRTGPVSGVLSRILPFLRPVRHPLVHCAMAVGGFISGSYLYSQRVEREADIASASTLHLEDAAVSLTEKKILRNLAERRKGTVSILANGNDLKEWDHPPLTTQLDYLKQL